MIQLIFIIYVLIYLVVTACLGLNFTKIREKYHIHPRIICFIFPLFINYILANFVFTHILPFFSVLLPCILGLIITLKFEKVRILGITGGIATGKSTLTRLIRDNFKNIDIIDCDDISRKLRRKGQPGYKLIVSMLGDKAQQFLNPLTQEFQEQQRKKLNQFVFKNKEFRDRLTRSMGALIMKKVFTTIFTNILTGKNVMLVDAPLLYETKILAYICFPVVVVGCSQKTQIERLTSRDNYTIQEAKTRIASQMPLVQKIKRAQIYLSNEGSEASLIEQFSARIKKYLSQKMPAIYMVDTKYSQQKKSQLRTENSNE